VFFIGASTSIDIFTIMKNASSPLEEINYLESHIDTFPRLALVQKTLEYPDLVIAKFNDILDE
jgi:hypothetical protein